VATILAVDKDPLQLELLSFLLKHSLFDVAYYDYKILLMFWLVLGVAASLPM
jgi:hypothetical protein